MLRVEQIENFDAPELAPYRTMRYQDEHRRQGIFVAENEKVVRRLLESNLEALSVVVPEKWVADYSNLLTARHRTIPLYVGAKRLLESLAGYEMYQGVMAVGKVPIQPSLEALLAKRDDRPSSHPLLLVAADGLTNSQNIGALARNSAAFGADALLCGETCCSPFLRRAVAASMGAVFRLPALELPSLSSALKQLRANGVRCIAAHPHADGRGLPLANFQQDCCIVVGSEGEGIAAAVLNECDDAVAIPMPPDIDSLNVVSASAAFLYEAARQRGQMDRISANISQ
jgi:tRNA G18 (ribose-2'-O)-methylase SpoU